MSNVVQEKVEGTRTRGRSPTKWTDQVKAAVLLYMSTFEKSGKIRDRIVQRVTEHWWPLPLWQERSERNKMRSSDLPNEICEYVDMVGWLMLQPVSFSLPSFSSLSNQELTLDVHVRGEVSLVGRVSPWLERREPTSTLTMYSILHVYSIGLKVILRRARLQLVLEPGVDVQVRGEVSLVGRVRRAGAPGAHQHAQDGRDGEHRYHAKHHRCGHHVQVIIVETTTPEKRSFVKQTRIINFKNPYVALKLKRFTRMSTY